MQVVKAIVAVKAAILLALSVAAYVDASGERRAVLRLVDAHPVSLRGSQFLAGEQVTVVAHSQGRVRTRKVVAGDGGGFVARFANLPFDRCQGFLAVANGARGSKARFKLPELMCRPRR